MGKGGEVGMVRGCVKLCVESMLGLFAACPSLF